MAINRQDDVIKVELIDPPKVKYQFEMTKEIKKQIRISTMFISILVFIILFQFPYITLRGSSMMITLTKYVQKITYFFDSDTLRIVSSLIVMTSASTVLQLLRAISKQKQHSAHRLEQDIQQLKKKLNEHNIDDIQPDIFKLSQNKDHSDFFSRHYFLIAGSPLFVPIMSFTSILFVNTLTHSQVNVFSILLYMVSAICISIYLCRVLVQFCYFISNVNLKQDNILTSNLLSLTAIILSIFAIFYKS